MVVVVVLLLRVYHLSKHRREMRMGMDVLVVVLMGTEKGMLIVLILRVLILMLLGISYAYTHMSIEMLDAEMTMPYLRHGVGYSPSPQEMRDSSHHRSLLTAPGHGCSPPPQELHDSFHRRHHCLRSRDAPPNCQTTDEDFHILQVSTHTQTHIEYWEERRWDGDVLPSPRRWVFSITPGIS